MRIIPVLDVMHGEVVSRRRRPASGVSSPRQPLGRVEPANRGGCALTSHFGCRELYVADLDAILGGEPAWPLYAVLHAQGFRLWVDAGIRRLTQACQLADAGIDRIVVGLETVAGPAELAEIVRTLGERIVFSLDLRQGEPLGERDAWQSLDAEGIAAQAVQLGVRRLLVLDLAQVGCDSGTGTREICARLSAKHPYVSISAGGGVRHRGDLEELRDCGVQAALVASALHDGRLTRIDLEGL